MTVLKDDVIPTKLTAEYDKNNILLIVQTPIKNYILGRKLSAINMSTFKSYGLRYIYSSFEP